MAAVVGKETEEPEVSIAVAIRYTILVLEVPVWLVPFLHLLLLLLRLSAFVSRRKLISTGG